MENGEPRPSYLNDIEREALEEDLAQLPQSVNVNNIPFILINSFNDFDRDTMKSTTR